jgi:hypothetical protein
MIERRVPVRGGGRFSVRGHHLCASSTCERWRPVFGKGTPPLCFPPKWSRLSTWSWPSYVPCHPRHFDGFFIQSVSAQEAVREDDAPQCSGRQRSKYLGARSIVGTCLRSSHKIRVSSPHALQGSGRCSGERQSILPEPFSPATHEG